MFVFTFVFSLLQDAESLLQNFELAWTNVERESNVQTISYPDMPEVTTYYDELMDSYNTHL